jgi:hypothetical protein
MRGGALEMGKAKQRAADPRQRRFHQSGFIMSFVQREADRIRSALQNTPLGGDFDRLYAAQQALAWIADPDWFSSPLDMIQRSLNGTLEGSRDCPSSFHPAQS